MIGDGATTALLGPGHTFGRNLARHFAGRKGGLYCLLQCEGQTKHTAMASGSRPAWKQELSFKSVQISSDLQVAPDANPAGQVQIAPCYLPVRCACNAFPWSWRFNMLRD